MMSQQSSFGQLLDEGISVFLTHSALDLSSVVASVKSPKAGAVVLFAGTRPHASSYFVSHPDLIL